MATMPGMPPPGAVEALASLSGAAFEERFLELMIAHQEGAIQMTNEEWQSGGDPRVRLLADQIRHAQRSQFTRMRALDTNTAALTRVGEPRNVRGDHAPHRLTGHVWLATI